MDTKKAIEILHALVVNGKELVKKDTRLVSEEHNRKWVDFLEYLERPECKNGNHKTGLAEEDGVLLKTVNFDFNLDALGCYKFKFCPDCGVEL
tara:strand:+ start:5313 stop:5591 length:279 start_codon:yes stop_codon:yes gene_type:complete